MDVSSLAASAVASSAQSTRDGFQIAALKIATQQERAVAGIVAQTAENAKAITAASVGGNLDQLA